MGREDDKLTAMAAGLAVFLSAALLVVMIRLAVDTSGGTMLGHFHYKTAPLGSMVSLDREGRIRMRPVAARAFRTMQKAARADGVDLSPIVAFRSEKDQGKLFFKKKAKNKGSMKETSRFCAPPGFSEHHTGFVIDLADGNAPRTDLEPTFRGTPAFKWMQKNASRYHFEMSFPPGNVQGVGYEPWHWRFVGDLTSFRTFYKSKSGVTYASMFPVP